LNLATNVPLAPLTTFELGGPARYIVDANDEADTVEALRWAASRAVRAFVLGGGSNLVVADEGWDGLVIRMRQRGITFTPGSGSVQITVRAGEPWDDVVAETVKRNLAGLECLSGIPGLAGATPIQNVGAYGQEVADTIRAVGVLDRQSLKVATLALEDCAFSYRNSAFKRDPERFVVQSVTFELRPGGSPTVRYRELEEALGSVGQGTRAPTPTLAEVRQTVLALRRNKSMVIDAADANRRSAGSFFTNPIVPAEVANRVATQAAREGLVKDASDVPRFPASGGMVKLAAGWLVERAGIPKGFRQGAVGISSRHALALVHHGGGTTAELLALARHVRDMVDCARADEDLILLGDAPQATRARGAGRPRAKKSCRSKDRPRRNGSSNRGAGSRRGESRPSEIAPFEASSPRRVR
jgi:UDP-N-acetylmuramate dehydrogenase